MTRTAMSQAIKIVAISGSLRKASHNTGLLRAIKEVAPEGVEIELHTLHDVPFYNGDVEEEGDPVGVKALKEAVAAADGVILASPEYNGSLSGVLKNGLDWLSRPGFKSVLAHKPVWTVFAAASGGGGARASVHLQNVLLNVWAVVPPMGSPMVGASYKKFSKDGELTDEDTKNYLEGAVAKYVNWLRDNR